MTLNREKMREYQRNRRKGLKKDAQISSGEANSCKPDVNHPPVNPVCKPKDVNLPANFDKPDCQCKHCQQNRRQKQPLVLNHGEYKTAEQLAANEVNRVSLPGDVDYRGIAC